MRLGNGIGESLLVACPSVVYPASPIEQVTRSLLSLRLGSGRTTRNTWPWHASHSGYSPIAFQARSRLYMSVLLFLSMSYLCLWGHCFSGLTWSCQDFGFLLRLFYWFRILAFESPVSPIGPFNLLVSAFQVDPLPDKIIVFPAIPTPIHVVRPLQLVGECRVR